MCLQDLQLDRAQLTVVTSFVTPGAGNTLILGPDKSRIGFAVIGPNNGTIDIALGESPAVLFAGRVGVNTGPSDRWWNISNYGDLVQGNVWATSSVNHTFAVVAMYLPMDRDQLQRLANQGKFGR